MCGYHSSNNVVAGKIKNDIERQLDLINRGIACSRDLQKKIKRNARFCFLPAPNFLNSSVFQYLVKQPLCPMQLPTRYKEFALKV